MTQRSRVLLVLTGLLATGLPAVAAPPSEIVPKRFVIQVGNDRLALPYQGTLPLGTKSLATRAVIVIHGADREAAGRFDDMTEAADLADAIQSGVRARTLIFAPQFLLRRDAIDFGLAADVLTYPDSGAASWKFGMSSFPGPHGGRVDSFTALDAMIRVLLDRTKYPKLRHLVLAGQSAGGQMLSRYAAANQIDAVARARGVTPRYLVANPSSYLYFDPQRPRPGSLDQMRLLTAAERAACPSYNKYYLGLADLSGYMATVGVARARSQFASRTVHVLVGECDRNPCNESLDNSCGAKWQGRHRFERGIAYDSYLGHYFGDGIYANHTFDAVPGVGHGSAGIYKSDIGLERLFDVTPVPCATPVLLESELTPRPRLRWIGTHTADEYELEIQSADGSVRTFVRRPDEAGCADGGYCSSSPAAASGSWWILRLRAVCGSLRSDPGMTTLLLDRPAAPTLLAPTGTVDVPGVAFEWNHVPGATQYELWVRRTRPSSTTPQIDRTLAARDAICDPDQPSNRPCDQSCRVLSVSIGAVLLDGDYEWKVRAQNGFGWGAWRSGSFVLDWMR